MSEIRKKQSEDYDLDDNKIKTHGSNIDVPDPGQEDMSQLERGS
jgi:hypothetical protein